VKFKQKRSVKLPTLSILLLIASCVVLNVSPTSRARAVTQYGGTLTVGIGATYPGFCVGNNPSREILSSYRTIYDTLVERDADGVLRPFLAESITSNPDNTVWTIKLRSGISYHNGETFDATNVKLNIDANRGALYVSQQKAYLLGTAVPGWANVLAVSVVDSSTVQINLELSQIDFLETLYGDGRFFLRSTVQLNSAQVCGGAPNGTGPFKFSSFTSDTLSVVRNNSYWRQDKFGNQLPFLDGLNFVNVREASMRSSSLRDGDHNAALFVSNYDSTFIKDLRLNSTSLQEFDSQNSYLETVFINAGKAGSPLRSLNARKALAAATDSTSFHSVRSGGLGDLSNALFPSNSVLHSSSDHIPYDLAKAKAYKAAYVVEGGSGPGGGVPFSVTIPSDTSSSSVAKANFLKTMWEQAGITTNVSIEESAVIIAKAFNAAGGTAQNAYEVIRLVSTFSSESSSQDTVYLRSDSFNPGTTNDLGLGTTGVALAGILGTVLNLSHHGNSLVDTKLLDARAQLTRKSAATKFRSALSYYQSQAYAIPLTNGFLALFADRQIEGFGTNYLPSGHQAMLMSSGGPDWSTVYVARSQSPVRDMGTGVSTQNIGWVGAQPKGLAFINSDEAYIARTDEGEICKVYLDNASVESCFDVGGRPVSLVLSPDKTKLFFLDPETNRVRRVVTSTGSVSNLVTLTNRPTSLALNTTGTQLFATSDISDVVYRIATIGGSILSTVSVPGGPDGISIEADGETMWISQSEFGSVIKAKSVDVANQPLDALTNITTIPVGNHPAASVLSSDGKYLFVTNINDGTLSRIDTQTLSVTHVMQVGAEPNAIALDDLKNTAIVAYRFGNSIGQVSLPALPVPTVVTPVTETPATPAVAAPASPAVAKPVVATPVAETPAAPVAAAPINSIPVSSAQSLAKMIVAPALSLKKPVTNKSIVTYSKLVVASTSKVAVKISPASAKYCKVVGTSVKALKAGSCKVTVTVTPKKGKPTSKTVTLKVAK
jgi:YVTN family beta-propeller protein